MIKFKEEKIFPYRKRFGKIVKGTKPLEIFEVLHLLEGDIEKIKKAIFINRKRKSLMYLEILEYTFKEIIRKYNELCIYKDTYIEYKDDTNVYSLNTRITHAASFFHRLSTGHGITLNTLMKIHRANYDTPYDYACTLFKYLNMMVNTISNISDIHFKNI